MRRVYVLAVSLVLAALVVGSAYGSASSHSPTTGTSVVLFPEGSVLRITNFTALGSFTVPAPGALFVGAASVDHAVLLMAWSNTTPLPLCPDVDGYVGSQWTYSVHEPLAPGFYRFGPVCGGLANLTVTQDIALLID